MRALALALATCLAALAFPVAAAAVKCEPPGSSGINEYYETIPGSSCNVTPPGFGPGSGSGTPHARHLTPRESRQLASQGGTGKAVARLVAQSAPPVQARPPVRPHQSVRQRPPLAGRSAAHAKPRPSPKPAKVVPLTARGENPISGALRPVITGSGTGTGPLLPIVLAAVALLAITALCLRLRSYRRGSSGES